MLSGGTSILRPSDLSVAASRFSSLLKCWLIGKESCPSFVAIASDPSQMSIVASVMSSSFDTADMSTASRFETGFPAALDSVSPWAGGGLV